MGKDVLHGDSLYIEELDYKSTLLLRPKLDMTNVKVWGKDATDLVPAFDIQKIELELSWWNISKMVWDAAILSTNRPYLTIQNHLIRVELNRLHLIDGVVTMHKTEEGNNHQLFRPPQERIRQFATGEARMAGGFVIDKFQATNVRLDYLKTISGNPNEALPKVYDVLFEDLSMKLSSDSSKAYFQHFETVGTIGGIRVKNNEGLVNRSFEAFGDAELVKLPMAQKLQNDRGFDLRSDNFNVAFKDLKARATGSLTTLNEQMKLDVAINSETGSEDKQNEALLSFLELTLSDRFLNIIKAYEPQGALTFDGRVYSKDEEYGGPIRIDLDYTAKETSFKFKFFENGQKHTVDDLEMKGIFRVGGEKPSYISADIENGRLYETQPFEANIVLDNVFRREYMDSLEQLLSPALVSVDFQSLNIDFNRFLKFLEFEKLDNTSGYIDFKNFHFSGPILSLAQSYSDLDYGGSFNFRKVALTYDNNSLPSSLDVRNATGSIQFNKEYASPNFKFEIGDQEVNIGSGKVVDIIPYILNQDREKLTLEEFEIEIPKVEVKPLMKRFAELSENKTKRELSITSIKQILDKVQRNIEARKFRISFPHSNVNGLYELDSINGNYPIGFEDISLTTILNIDDQLEFGTTLVNGIDTISATTILNSRGDLQSISQIGMSISDLRDIACKIGIDIPLGEHLDESVELQAEVMSSVTANDKEITSDVLSDRIYLLNESLEITGGLSDFRTSTTFSMDSSKITDASLDFSLVLDEETLDLELRMDEDSIKINTDGQQRLKFSTAKKYLSLVCAIDQNLQRINNLEGEMLIDARLEEHLGERGINVIMHASRVGSFGMENLAFDFQKGSDNIHFDGVDGNILYDNEGIRIESFSGNYIDSDFRIYDTNVDGLLEFVLLGEPINIDTLHLTSSTLDLATIFDSNTDVKYTCENEEIIEEETICPKCIVQKETVKEEDPIAFSIINFLKSSTINYADAYFDRILFKPIRGSELFEIDNLTASGQLVESKLEVHDLTANLYDGFIYQYQPLEVFVKNQDTLTVTGGYTVEDLELHEVIEKLNNMAVADLKSDRLDFKGRLSMDFDFIDTLTSETDINSLEFRINEMTVLDGSTKALTTVGMDKKWKENVKPTQRFLANLFLGNFNKRFKKPTKYVVNLENMVLDKGWVNYDLLEFYNNQVNVISTGSYEVATGKRDIDLLLQKRDKKYDYSAYASSYCKNGFLTYFHIEDDPEKSQILAPPSELLNQWKESYNACIRNCPCDQSECVNTCSEIYPKPQETNQITNKISLAGNKRLKENCK